MKQTLRNQGGSDDTNEIFGAVGWGRECLGMAMIDGKCRKNSTRSENWNYLNLKYCDLSLYGVRFYDTA